MRISDWSSDVCSSDLFDIAFQPICDLRTGRPHHFEALVRFDHETMGATPYEFVTFAEEVGIIVEFDLAMCRKVLGWLGTRSEERRVGKECVRTCRSRGWTEH